MIAVLGVGADACEQIVVALVGRQALTAAADTVVPLTPTFDPSLVAVFFLLAPMHAAVYGSLGLTLGYAWLAFGKRASS